MKLYISPKGLNNNIIYTQLYLPLTYLSDTTSIRMLAHSSFNNYVLSQEIELYFYDSLKNKVNYILSNKTEITSVYTRSIFDFYLIFFLKFIFRLKLKIRYDFRGLLSEESFLRNGNIYKKKIIRIIENLVLKFADSVSTVSNNFKKYLIEITPNRNDIRVTPCCTVSAKLKVRSESTNIKFVYVGSLGKWQNFEEMLMTYSHIINTIPNCDLTVITNDVDRAKKICENFKVIANVFSVKNSEINDILPVFDFGFLLRDNILLNNVASPVKFLEYTSNGVIPILSEGVGDYSEVVKDLKIGIVIKDKQDITSESLFDLKSDDLIYKRLYDFSVNYTWENNYLNFDI